MSSCILRTVGIYTLTCDYDTYTLEVEVMNNWYHEDSDKKLKKVNESKMPGRTVASSQFSIPDQTSSTASSRENLPKSNSKAANGQTTPTEKETEKTIIQQIKKNVCCCFFVKDSSQKN